VQLLIELLVAGSIAGVKVGIAALGFALVFYTTKEMHFAFGALSVLGAYVCYWIVTSLAGGPVGIVVGVVVALAVTAIVSVAMHRYLYLRLNDVTPVLMASLGISILIENLLQITASPEIQILSYPVLTQVMTIGFLRERLLDLCVVALFLSIAIGLDIFLNRTRVGQGLSAAIEDPEMAELVGIRTSYMRIGAYCAGAVLGTTSGIISLLDTGIKPANGFLLLLYALIVTIIGRGSLRMVAIWSVLFGMLRSLWSWQFATDYTELAVFGILVLYLMARDNLSHMRSRAGNRRAKLHAA
jgi:branched-chain amino acid transport system permease protein